MEHKAPAWLVLFADFAGQLPENSPLSADQFVGASILYERMSTLLELGKATFDGLSWRPGVPYGLLVVKATVEDKPSVCFVRERDILTCVRILTRMVLENRVPWKPDKFR